MDLYEQRVLRLREHVLSHEAKQDNKKDIDYDKITIPELKKLLDEKGIEYDKNEKKAELWAKLEEFAGEQINDGEESDDLIGDEEDSEEAGE